MRVVQEVVRICTVVAHHAGQGRAVMRPVALAKSRGGIAVDLQVLAQVPVIRRWMCGKMRVGVVQRVVEIE